MSNILVICIERIPSAVLGVYEPLKALEDSGGTKVKFSRVIEVSREDLDWCDIIILVRSSEELELRIAKACKKAGKYLIYYLDDDLLNLPDLVSDASYYRDQVLRRNLVNIIQTCDVLWAVNPKICGKYGTYAKKTVITKGPAIILNLGPAPKKNEDPLIIGFAGSKDHAKTLDSVVGDAIQMISNEYGNRIRFEFLGAKPMIVNSVAGAKYIPYIFDAGEYREFMHKSNWSIGLAPLPTGEFFKCKYYNKFLEYGAIECAGIYTDTEPFTYIVKNEVNGILCKNTAEDWYNALKLLIDNRELRRRIAQNAYVTLKNDYTVLEVGKEAASRIPELINYHSAHNRVKLFGLTHAQNQIFLWYNKCLRLIKKYWILAIFIILYQAVRKILRMLKIIKGW